MSTSPNPLVSHDRRLGQSSSAWVRQFDCQDLKPLVICRGPIRKEAMDVFNEMGIDRFGILLSEKDSVTYSQALAPELRSLTDPTRVHRVQDYSGATKEERQARIAEMISIAHQYGYNSIYAGYGFMSEDADMVSAMEDAGLCFMGPGSHVQSAAGLKDEAKRTATHVSVSVTPGVDDATTQAVLKKAGTIEALRALAEQHELLVDWTQTTTMTPAEVVGLVLESAYEKGIDIYTLEEVIAALNDGIRTMFTERPHARVRLKAISGGGGKGQRILKAPQSYTEYSSLSEQIEAALSPLSGLVREVLAEVKCLGVGDNKNVVAELNVEETSHQEIQVVGNGEWCITMGGRDCSLQMHEQKLLEVSVIDEELVEQLSLLSPDHPRYLGLSTALNTLRKMEAEASRFGQAVGLDSVSTFECIVSGDEHYFMEMNTRIQVEHRVTELCYKLRFTNPENADDYFEVDSLVELMVLIARHKKALPKPSRHLRHLASVEARMNATNDALKPHAGGVILDWSAPIKGEIRDDQGISSHNPDTGAFMRYHLAGAYDSNIALLLTVGQGRTDSYAQLAEVFRLTKLEGDLLCTNLHFHYGLIHWFMTRDVYGRANTKFVAQYLAAVGALAEESAKIDIGLIWTQLQKQEMKRLTSEGSNAQLAQPLFDARSTLILRPIKILLNSPHLFAGWLSIQRSYIERDQQGHLVWKKNPLEALAALYHFLNLEYREDRPALQQIWSHDHELLTQGLQFYEQLAQKLASQQELTWTALCEMLSHEIVPEGFDSNLWQACRNSHCGHQLGLELLLVLEQLGINSAFSLMEMTPEGQITVPQQFIDAEQQAYYTQKLAPPPVARAGELVAVSGGMFYPREAPDQPKLIEVGDHFEEGQALYIIEVMKMFNKVYAPFSGTITEALVDGEGVIIKKGQPLFKVKPDYEPEIVDLDELKTARVQDSLAVLKTVLN